MDWFICCVEFHPHHFHCFCEVTLRESRWVDAAPFLVYMCPVSYTWLMLTCAIYVCDVNMLSSLYNYSFICWHRIFCDYIKAVALLVHRMINMNTIIYNTGPSNHISHLSAMAVINAVRRGLMVAVEQFSAAGSAKGNVCLLSLDAASQAKGYWLIFYHRVMTSAGEHVVTRRMKSRAMLVTDPFFKFVHVH